MRKRARVARVALARVGFEHVAGQNQGVLFAERVHVSRFRIGHEDHVARFDALPAVHGRTVEGLAVFEGVFGELMGGHGDVLFLAAGIGQAVVDELDVVVLDHLQNVCGRSHDGILLTGKSDLSGFESTALSAAKTQSKFRASFVFSENPHLTRDAQARMHQIVRLCARLWCMHRGGSRGPAGHFRRKIRRKATFLRPDRIKWQSLLVGVLRFRRGAGRRTMHAEV